MKSISEIGISPTPWRIRIRGGDYDVVDNNDEIVFEYQFEKADIRFAAAAPKMYEALRELYLTSIEPVGGTKEDREKQSKKYEKALDNARAALMEASGECEVK